MGSKRRHLPKSVHPNTEIAESARINDEPSLGESLMDAHVGEGARIDELTIVYRGAVVESYARVGTNCVVGPSATVKVAAVIGDGCYVGAGAVVGKEAVVSPRCVIAPGCGIGTECYLGPGVLVLAQRRLPKVGRAEEPATVGAGARVGGGAVICGGCSVGKGAVVAAGEVVEDDVPDGAVWMGGRIAGRLEGETWE